MAGYIGKSQGVTQVDGYNRTEADGRYVNASGDTMTGTLSVTGGRLYVGQTAGDYAQFGKDTGGNAFIDATQADADFGIYINSTSTGYNKKFGIDSAGRVTMPYQPSWSLQPNHSTGIAYTGATIVDFAVTPNNRCFANGVTVSSGRVTVPVAGKYSVTTTFRQENAQTNYQLVIIVNGSDVARGGIWYSSQAYETIQMSRVLSLSANDYIEVRLDFIGSVNGYNDMLTFFEGYLIG